MPRFAIAVTDEDSNLQLVVVEAPDWQVALIECQASPYTVLGPLPDEPEEDDFDEEEEYQEAFGSWQSRVENEVFTPASIAGLPNDDFNHGHVVRIVEIE